VFLITGASGFVGDAVIQRLISDDASVVAAVRRKPVHWSRQCSVVEVGNMEQDTDWSLALAGITAVVHTAARVHVMNEQSADPLAEFRRVNVAGTLNLARQAAEAGVRRFVFLSSIKVNGEKTQTGYPFNASDMPNPSDPYGVSKYEAEVGLRQIAEKTGMEVVIIRPVLVYGAGVKGNFLSMMRWLHKDFPLPLGGITNKRSLVSIDNLVDLIVTCLHHPAAANQTFLVSDGEDLSTTELLQRTAFAMGCKAKLISIPAFIMQAGASVMGKGDVAQRLYGSLQVDISKTRSLLGWNPPLTVGQGLDKVAESFLLNEKN
jgi:UDP-glucose 4-epimerase